MLTISKPLSSTQAQTYHAKEFTAAEQNYWKQGDTIQGEWRGKLAEEFGLSGGIGALEFFRLAEGQHPATGEQLVDHRQPGRVRQRLDRPGVAQHDPISWTGSAGRLGGGPSGSHLPRIGAWRALTGKP